MADDTRQDETPAQAPTPPRGPANIMPGGTAHTAGGEKFGNEPSYVEVVKSLGPQYYLNFHKRPCVRDSQLTGIAAGFVGGSLGAIIRKPAWLCSNYAVLTWLGVSCASYQYCQYFRSKEKDGIKQAKELMEVKRANVEAKREARRRAREEQERQEEERRQEEQRRKSWGYWVSKNVKFW
ncbi:hypothetical protein BS50DRAFT_603193 [Corynespora cassiicola Philippines]|uniref:Cytochrome c oxidase assembly protein COX20, mitochondrial n=1 Tax=Corynespora cassiicola Philippines TaxID=1448308 RepID=A0A2T2NAR0_CORCC|nr:hypothetical protein BS50DRAFT_603193 [Corynespora cassiicola Philippines]